MDKPAGVMLGEAREEHVHALLFGSAADIQAAEGRIAEALRLQAVQRRVRRAGFIESTLARLPRPQYT